MRADRLVHLLLVIQRRGRLTAAQAANELGVSVATARRDLEALSSAGVPLYSQAGRGGGWELVGGARTDLTGFTEQQARSLAWLVGARADDDPATGEALLKLIQALPVRFRADAELATRSAMVDPTRWGEVDAEAPAGLSAVRSAIVDHRELDAVYTARGRESTARRLRPLGLVDKAGDWYLVADSEKGRRTYRLDRFTNLTVSERTFEPPVGVELDRLWAATREEVERLRGSVLARVKAPSGLVPILQRQFGRHCRIERPGEPTLLTLGGHLIGGLAEQLAGWGDRIEVLEPRELRSELLRLGHELVARYSEPDPRACDPAAEPTRRHGPTR